MWSVRIPKFQTGSRLVSVSVTEGIHFVFNANPYLLWHMRSYSWMIKSQLHVKQVCLLSIIIYQMLQAKKKWPLKKTVSLVSFQKTQYYCNPFQSQLCPSMALFVLVALFVPSFQVCALTFMSHPVWWWFPLFKFW